MAHSTYTSNLEEKRPGSSSGTASATTTTKTRSKKADFDKRKSRDDLALLNMAAEKQRFLGFHKPIRGRPSLDVQSPGVPRRSTSDSNVNEGPVSIGMALGSPEHHVWPNTITTTISSDAQELERKPSRKWGLFSRSKSKRGRSNTTTEAPFMPPQPSTIMSPTGAGMRPVELRQETTISRSKSVAVKSSTSSKSHGRSESEAMKSRRHVPTVVRSHTEPVTSPRIEGGLAPRPSREGPRPSIDAARTLRSVPEPERETTKPERQRSRREREAPRPLREAPARPDREAPQPPREALRPSREIPRPEREAPPRPQREPHVPERTQPPPERALPQVPDINLPIQGPRKKAHKPPPVSGPIAAMARTPTVSLGPMLDVEIPDITLERYSLMFGHLLPKRQQGQKSPNTSSPLPPLSQLTTTPLPPQVPDKSPIAEKPQVTEKPQYVQQPTQPQIPDKLSQPSSSSLLARRQATLNQLKQLRDESQSPPNLQPKTSTCRLKKDESLSDLKPPRPRREISPAKDSPACRLKKDEQIGPLKPPRPQREISPPKASPTFCLFPPTPKRTSVVHLQSMSPSSRGRSNTSPVGTTASSSRSTPESSQGLRAAPRASTFPKGSESSGSQDDRQPRRLLTSRFQRQPTGNQIPISAVNSPTSIVELFSPTSIKMPIYPAAKEPSWEMMTPPTSEASPTNLRMRTHSRKESISSITDVEHGEHISVLVKVTSQEEQEEQALRDAVEASIHRQISLSREQREMLRPFQRSVRRKKKDVKPLSIVAVATGRNERIVETKKAIPMLVHPGDENDSPRTIHIRQKSSQGIVEGSS